MQRKYIIFELKIKNILFYSGYHPRWRRLGVEFGGKGNDFKFFYSYKFTQIVHAFDNQYFLLKKYTMHIVGRFVRAWRVHAYKFYFELH